MPDANPLVAQSKQDGDGPGPLTAGNGDYGYAGGIGVAESAMDAFNGIKDGDWVSGGLGVLGLAGEVASAAIDPFGYLMSSVASFLMEHIQPLKDMLDSLAGDPPVIQSYSQTWGNVAKSLEESQVTFANAVKNGTSGWQGSAADAYRQQAAEQAEAIGGAATVAGAIGTVVMIMGEVVAFVREFVRQLIADLVGKLISWVMETVFSLGFGTPVVVAQAVTAISEWGAKIAEKLKDLLETIRRVSPLLGKLGDVFAKIIKIFGKLAGKVAGLDVVSTKSIKGTGFVTHGTHGGSGGGTHAGGGGGSGDGGSSRSGDSGGANGSGGSDGSSGSNGNTSRSGGGTDEPSASVDSGSGNGSGSSDRSGGGDGGSPSSGDSGSPSHAGDNGDPPDSGGGNSSRGSGDSAAPSHTGDGSPTSTSADGATPNHVRDSGSPARTADSGGSPAHAGDSPPPAGDGSPAPTRGSGSPSHTGDGSSSPGRGDAPGHASDSSPSTARAGDSPGSGSPGHAGDSGGSPNNTGNGGGSPSHADAPGHDADGGGSPSRTSDSGAPAPAGNGSPAPHAGSPSGHPGGDSAPHSPRPGDSATSASGYAPPATPRTGEPGVQTPSQRGGDASPSTLPPQGQPMAGGMPPGGAPAGAPGGAPGGSPGGRPAGAGWTGTPGSPGAPAPRTPETHVGPGGRGPDGPPRQPDVPGRHAVARGGSPAPTAPGTHSPGGRPDGRGPGGPHRDVPHGGAPHHEPGGGAHEHGGTPGHDQPGHLTPDEVNQRHSEGTPAGSSYHRGDPDMGDLPHRVQPDPDGRYTVDVHVTPDGHARIGNRRYTPEEFADVLRHNADYDGRPIRLIGCDAGSNDFAKRLSRELDVEVMAPSKPAWTDSNGRVFSSDYEVGPDGRMRPKIPPNGEWEVHSPDGSAHRAGEDGFTPDTHDADKHDLDPDDAVDRGQPPFDQNQHDQDMRDLRQENRDRRAEGLDEVKGLNGNRNPTTDDLRRPHERALTTARFRDADGQVDDLYSFSGRTHDWSPAKDGPEYPKHERLFGTKDAGTYRPGLGVPDPDNKFGRIHDSEPKLLEENVRRNFAARSGLDREEVDDIIKKEIEKSRREEAAKTREYRDSLKGETARARDRMDGALDEINHRATERAHARGETFTPITRESIEGDMRMVVDLPSAKRDGIPLEYQICDSCTDVIIQYKRLFPNVRVEVVNLAGERLM
jgi:hypothetical protein